MLAVASAPDSASLCIAVADDRVSYDGATRAGLGSAAVRTAQRAAAFGASIVPITSLVSVRLLALPALGGSADPAFGALA